LDSSGFEPEASRALVNYLFVVTSERFLSFSRGFFFLLKKEKGSCKAGDLPV